MSSSPSPNEAFYESDEEEKSANITLKRIRILSHHIPQESCLTNPHTSIMQPNDDERKLAATEDRTVDQDASRNPEVMHDNDPIFEYPGTTETRLRSSFASTSTSTTGKRKRITEALIDVRENENDNIPHNVNAEYWQNLLARSQISLGQRQLDLVATASHSDAVATASAPVNAEGPEEQFARINVPRLRALQYALTHPERQNEDSGSIPSGEGAVIHPASVSSIPIPALQPNAINRDLDSALHIAIRDNAIDTALLLLQEGAPIHATNAKRVTPLILAAQKGSIVLVRELLRLGASPHDVSRVGSSAMLQAAHFGHLAVVQLLVESGGLVELANYKHTTPLMRASQEGHALVVLYLMEHGAVVNRRNNEYMSALMLAAQRGHAHICQLLVDAHADVDAMTIQRSTSLMLACKREHVDVVKILITGGCELMVKDSRGRTARDVTKQRHIHSDKTKELLVFLDPQVQVMLMREKARIPRNYEIIKMWTLLQQERGTLHNGMVIHDITFDSRVLNDMKKSIKSLILTMTLPAPMVELISTYMPLPSMWSTRLTLLTKRTTVDPDSAVASALDLIDEVLEEGGFVEACDTAKLLVPSSDFKSWAEWKAHCKRHERADPAPEHEGRPNALQATLPGLPRLEHTGPRVGRAMTSAVDQRRGICFLQLLAYRSPCLQRVLSMVPYNMPQWLIQQLITVNDIQSLSARLGPKGVKFEPALAMEMVMLASSVCSWFERERENA